MPKYTLMHGGLRLGRKLYRAGTKDNEVELSADEAAHHNRRGEVLRLSASVAAEAEAEKKKKAAIDAAEKKAAAEAEAEKKKKTEKGGGQ